MELRPKVGSRALKTTSWSCSRASNTAEHQGSVLRLLSLSFLLLLLLCTRTKVIITAVEFVDQDSVPAQVRKSRVPRRMVCAFVCRRSCEPTCVDLGYN